MFDNKKKEFTEALSHSLGGKQLRIIYVFFVCNRGDTYYSIIAGSRQGSLAKPLSLLFLTPRPALSSHQHRTLVCLLIWKSTLCFLTSKSHFCSQVCFELLDVSNSSNYSFSDTWPSLGLPRVTILSASSMRTLVHCETQ